MSMTEKTWIKVIKKFASESNIDCLNFLDDGINISETLNYSQLDKHAENLSRNFRLHSNFQDRVLILLPQSLDFIKVFFGCLYGGLVAVPLYPPKANRENDKIINIIKDCEPRIIITNNEIYNYIKSLCSNLPLKILNIDTDIIHISEQIYPIEITENTIAFLQYTSGSTCQPKGVMLTHANLLANMKMIQTSMKITTTSIVYSWLPFFHDMGLIGCVLQPLYSNCKVYLTSPIKFLNNPKNWITAIAKYKVSITGGPNFSFDLINRKYSLGDYTDLDLSSLKVLFNGAEPIRKETLLTFANNFKKNNFQLNVFFPCYGLAEASLFVSGSSYVTTEKPLVDSGEIADGLTLLIVDHHGKEVEDEVEGEILISGLNVTSGYWKKNTSEWSQKIIYTHNNRETIGLFFKTGDIGYKKHNKLYVTGRKKDLIIINGVNYYPQDIEYICEKSISDIIEGSCAVIGVNNSHEEELYVICEVKRNTSNERFIQIENLIKEVVANNIYINVSRVILLKPTKMPKTSSGKLQRHKIKDLIMSKKIESIYDSSDSYNEKEKNSIDLIKIENWLHEYILKKVNIHQMNERRTIPPHLVLDFGNQGLLGMIVPKQYSGLGASLKEISYLVSRISQYDISLALFVGLNNILGIYPLLASSNLILKNKYLPMLATGKILGCFAITEEAAGSNPKSMLSKSIKLQNNKWRISGEKIWIGSGSWSTITHFFSKAYNEENELIGVGAHLIDSELHQISYVEEAITMGVKPLVQTRIRLDNEVVEDTFSLTCPEDGMKLAFNTMKIARFGLCSISSGAITRCQSYLTQYARHRSISTGLLIENGYVSAFLREIETKKLIIDALINVLNNLHEKTNIEDISEIFYCSCKITGPEYLYEISDRTLQLLGGRGYIETNLFPALHRDARLLRIFEGPTETIEYHLGTLVKNKKSYTTFLDQINLENSYFESVFNETKIEPLNTMQEQIQAIYIGKLFNIKILKFITKENSTAQLILDNDYANTLANFKKKIKLTENFFTSNQCNTTIPNVSNERLTPDTEFLQKRHPGYTQVDVTNTISEKTTPPPSFITKKAVANSEVKKSAHNTLDFLSKTLNKITNGKISQVSPNANLLTLGIDSITAAELSIEIEEKFNVKVPENLIWEYPTVSDVVNYLEKISKKNNL